MGDTGNWVRHQRRRIRVAVLTLVTASCLWVITATFGVADVVALLHRDAQGLNQELGPLNRLDFDPDVQPPLAEKKMPWYFVGNASAPFPLVVAVDSAHQVAPLAGGRSRIYVFWLFGLKLLVHDEIVWLS